MRNGLSIEMEPAAATRCAPEAFEELFREHQRAVYGWILRMVRDRGVAEDLTIETFWRIYRSWQRFDVEREFAPWARRIAARVALDWLRTQPRERAEPEEFFTALPAPRSGDAAMDAEVRQKVARALAALPPKLRAAAVLAVVEQCPQREIAAALGISPAAVKLRVWRALRSLRSNLERQGIRP